MKLGRKPRGYHPSVPHMSALMGGRKLAPPPISTDNSHGMPADFGMMLNDELGDCTCAAYYHARQVWSFAASKDEITEPDDKVLELYEKACGYDPSNPYSDQGGVEQDVLSYLLKKGAPNCDPIIGFIEVDCRNLDDMKRAIYETGCVYIGVNLPENIVAGAEPPAIWDTRQGDAIAGGHAIILCGYDLDGFDLISWGKKYRCTNRFIAAYCEEAYAIADRKWIRSTGRTPLGLTIDQLNELMRALKYAY